ncbi:MAG: DNA polymerase III subunit delta [Pseudomonadota bacterium]
MKKSAEAAAPGGNDDLWLLFGDEFLVKEQVRQLVDRKISPELQKTNLIVFDGNNLDLGDLSSQLFTPSLFGGERVILVDQTPVFMSRTDRGKLLAKTVQAWRAGSRRASVKALSQLLSLAGIDPAETRRGSEWVSEAAGDSISAEDGEILRAAAQALLDDGGAKSATNDEHLIEHIISQPFPEGTVLVFTAPGVDRRKKVVKIFDKRGRVVECAAREQKYGAGLDRSFFDERVKEWVSEKGKKISRDGLDELYARSGKELRRLHGEIEKLVGFIGERDGITAKDVQAVVPDFHEASFFDLANALRTADIKKCLPALHENLKLVDHPLQTLGAIASDMRKLLVARELLFTVFRTGWRPNISFEGFKPLAQTARDKHPEMAQQGKYKLLAMKDYPLYLALKDAQRFPMDKLVRIMEALLEADVMLKSSRLGYHSPKSILENLVFVICSPASNLPSQGQGLSKH